MEASGADCIIADLETSDKVDRLSADIKHKILVGEGVKVGVYIWTKNYNSPPPSPSPLSDQTKYLRVKIHCHLSIYLSI